MEHHRLRFKQKIVQQYYIIKFIAMKERSIKVYQVPSHVCRLNRVMKDFGLQCATSLSRAEALLLHYTQHTSGPLKIQYSTAHYGKSKTYGRKNYSTAQYMQVVPSWTVYFIISSMSNKTGEKLRAYNTQPCSPLKQASSEFLTEFSKYSFTFAPPEWAILHGIKCIEYWQSAALLLSGETRIVSAIFI